LPKLDAIFEADAIPLSTVRSLAASNANAAAPAHLRAALDSTAASQRLNL